MGRGGDPRSLYVPDVCLSLSRLAQYACLYTIKLSLDVGIQALDLGGEVRQGIYCLDPGAMTP